jgi:hypothetical protein
LYTHWGVHSQRFWDLLKMEVNKTDVKKGDLIIYSAFYTEILECYKIYENKKVKVQKIASDQEKNKYIGTFQVYNLSSPDPSKAGIPVTIIPINTKDLILYTHWGVHSQRFWDLLKNGDK